VVSGPHVLNRYFNNDEAINANKIIVNTTEWHRTGDSGFMIEGELYLTGRCKQLITWQGQFISPFVIENQLQLIEGVTMGTLMKVNDTRVLVLETKRSKNVLEAVPSDILYDRIEYMKIPRDPRHQSKIDYSILRKRLSL
jgi:acyl-CoA synthetase (AMP-forming)/AMP-acid ligase II